MRTTVKILLFCVLISGCCSQKRAERKLERLVKEYPELLELKARPFEALITVPGYTDLAIMPMRTIANGGTMREETEHGTIVVSMNLEDSTLCVGFVADTQIVCYQDTLRYRQAIVVPEQTKKGILDGFGERLAEWISFLAIGIVVTLYLLRNSLKNK